MFGTRFFPMIPGTIALCACAVAPPTGPAVVALPPAGKNLAQFQQEDITCRGYAQQQIGYGEPRQAVNEGPTVSAAAGGSGTGEGGGSSAGSAMSAGNISASAAALQQRYDVAYAQCMAASGNSLQTFSMAALYGPYGYPYGYPYSTWYGSPISLGFFGSFEPHFHHHFDSFHGGFRRSS
jgi:hypothetical protein